MKNKWFTGGAEVGPQWMINKASNQAGNLFGIYWGYFRGDNYNTYAFICSNLRMARYNFRRKGITPIDPEWLEDENP